MSAIAEAASSPELHLGVAAGALAIATIALVPAMRRVPITVVTGAGAAAVVVAMARSMTGGWWTVLGLAGLAGAAAVRSASPQLALVTVGILALAASAPSRTAGGFLGAAVVVAALAVADVVAARGPALTAALLALSVAGVWAAVPDTEEILLVGGVLALPLVVTVAGGLDRLDVRWSLPSAAAIVGPVVWAAVVGGRGRPGSMVGGVACLGVLLVEPAARRIARRPATERPPVAVVVVVVAVQVGLVAITARVAATHTAVGPAALVSAAALAAGTAVLSSALVALPSR